MQQMQERTFLPLSGATTTPTSSYFAPLSSSAYTTSSNLHTEINDAQHEETAERISSLHARLQQEAEKIRKWKIHTELDIRQKDHKIQEATQTIESLRKGVLELQIQNENLSLKLQEEIDNRSEIVQRNSATREMCNILKDYASKVEDRLKNCETERTELNYAEKQHSEQFDNLSEQFMTLEITATENYNKLNDQLTSERIEKKAAEKEYKETLENTETELHTMIKTSDSKTVEIDSLSSKLEDNLVRLMQLQQDYEMIEKELEMAKLKSLEKQEQLLQTNSKMQALKDSLMREIDELQIERESLRRTIDLQKEEISKLLEKVKTSQDKICRSEENLAHRAQLIDGMTIQVTNMTKQIKEYEQELEHTKRELRDALEREKTSYDETELLSTQLREARENCKDEENKAIKEHDLRENLEKEGNQLKKECSKLKKDLSSAKKVETDLLEQANDIREEIDQLQQQLHHMEEEVKEQGDKASSKIQAEVSNTKSLQKEIEKKTKTLVDLQDKFKETKNDLTSKNKQIKELDKELNKSKRSLDELTAEKEKAARDHEIHETELIAVFDKYKKMGDDLAIEQQKELDAGRKALEETKVKKSEMEKLQKDYERVKTQLSNIEKNQTSEVHSLQKEVNDLISKLNEQNILLEEKETGLESYARKESAWTNEEKTQQSKHEKLLEDCCKKEAKLQKQLDKAKEELKSIRDKEKDHSKKVKELEKARAKMENSKHENDQILEHLENENAKLKKLENDYAEKLAENEVDKNRIVKLQGENHELQQNLEKLKKCTKKESEERKTWEMKNDELQNNIEKLKKQQNKEDNVNKAEEKKNNELQKMKEKLKKQQNKEAEEEKAMEKKQEKILEKDRQEVRNMKKKMQEKISEKKMQAEKSKLCPDPEDTENIKTGSKTTRKGKASPERQLTALKPVNRDLSSTDDDDSQVPIPNVDHVMQTPQRSILRQLPSSSAKKRRVMFASDDEDCNSDSSSELMEIEVDDIDLRLKNQSGQMCTTPLRVRPSPRVRPSSDLGSPMDYTRTPLKPVPRGPPMSTPLKPLPRGSALSRAPVKSVPRGEKVSEKLGGDSKQLSEINKFKELYPAEQDPELFSEPKLKKKYQATPLSRTNVRKTPNRPQGKFFKSPPSDRKKIDSKKKVELEKLSWFDSDTVFGFGAED